MAVEGEETEWEEEGWWHDALEDSQSLRGGHAWRLQGRSCRKSAQLGLALQGLLGVALAAAFALRCERTEPGPGGESLPDSM